MLATAGSVWMHPALAVIVLGAIGQVTALQSIVMLDAVLLRVQLVLAIGRHRLDVEWRALVVMVLDAIDKLTASQSNAVWDAMFVRVQSRWATMGYGLGVSVADIRHEGVGWCWGCGVRSHSIGVAAVLGPNQRRQELAVKEVRGRFVYSHTWRVSHITGLPSRCLLAPNPQAHLKFVR